MGDGDKYLPRVRIYPTPSGVRTALHRPSCPLLSFPSQLLISLGALSNERDPERANLGHRVPVLSRKPAWKCTLSSRARGFPSLSPPSVVQARLSPQDCTAASGGGARACLQGPEQVRLEAQTPGSSAALSAPAPADTGGKRTTIDERARSTLGQPEFAWRF